MSKHGRFDIRRWRDPATGREGITFWCPGCRCAHSVGVDGPAPNWTFNGDYDHPVLTPSIRVYTPAHRDPDDGQQVPERTDCHCYVGSNGAQPGEIIFLADSYAHQLRGVHPLEPWPANYGFAGEEP